MKKTFLLINVCFVTVVSACGNYKWEPTGPTAEDIQASMSTSLQSALKKGDLLSVEEFLKQGGDVNAPCGYGLYMLTSAVKHRHMHLVQFLVEHGADINKHSDFVRPGDARGETALMFAVYNQDLNMVKYLVEKGADFRATDSQGYTPATWVKKFSLSPEIRNYFQELVPDVDDQDAA